MGTARLWKVSIVALGLLAGGIASATEAVKLGFNYPKTGPYAVQGLDQWRAAMLALEEINGAGGILGKRIELLETDSRSNAAVSIENGTRLIETEKVKMIFGGVASSVAIAVGKVSSDRKIPFFGTLSYAAETTGIDGRKFVFRECYDSYASGKVLGEYFRRLGKKKFFYITSRYTWGYSTERAIRKASGSGNPLEHPRAYTPFPDASAHDIALAIAAAKAANPDVLVLTLFGSDMVRAIKDVHRQGLKSKMQVVVPNLTLGMAEGAGPEAMEGVIGAIPWTARVPELTGSETGRKFVEKFAQKYERLPDTAGASAYTILHEYKAAVERAKSFDGPAVVAAIEGHEYRLLKDRQYWRAWDHQSIQTVYAVRGKKASEVRKSRFQQEYFEVIGTMDGEEAFIPRAEWEAARKMAVRPIELD